MTNENTKSLTLPTVHRNGTSADALLDQTCEAANAVRAAIRALESNGPNGRDYYPQGDSALRSAMAEHTDRIARLVSVLRELETVAEHISDAS